MSKNLPYKHGLGGMPRPETRLDNGSEASKGIKWYLGSVEM